MTVDFRSSNALSLAAVLLGMLLVGIALYVATPTLTVGDSLTIQRANAEDRNLYGSARAGTIIVEFSDYQCPYCARVHPTLKRLVDDSNGTVAWEYRHLPLRSHPLAAPAAIVAECLSARVSKEAFWQFTDDMFVNQKLLSETYIKDKVIELGLSTDELEFCGLNPAIEALVRNDTDTAAALGGSGTPFSVVIFPDNSYKTVSGAVPYEQWVTLLQSYVE